MSARLRRLSWFGGLYFASIAAFVLVTLVIRTVLRLIS
jgi:hypothetical protein